MDNVEKRIAEAIVRWTEAWGDPDCIGHADWFAPFVKRLIETAHHDAWHKGCQQGSSSAYPAINWDALLVSSPP